MTDEKPWLEFYGDVPHSIDYPDLTLYQALHQSARRHANAIACDFLGKQATYRELIRDVDRFAGALARLGLQSGDRIMAMPLTEYRPNSIGIPFPDMSAKIVKIGSSESVEIGQDGEICISGPAVMLGYYNNPSETEAVLKQHADGQTWLHTGDIGSMDADGFFYFKLRLKRMIKSSGMNVYPVQVEDILYRHPAVAAACVIGVPDLAQVQRVKAFVVPKDASQDPEELKTALLAHCREHLNKWSCPREVEFRDSLPRTLIGKVDFKALEGEEIERLKAAGEYTGEADR